MTQPDLNNQRRVVAVLGFSLLALALIVKVVLAITPPPPAAAVQIIPSIAISKLPDTQDISEGGTATFTIEVTNNGLADLQNVTVTDPFAADCDKTIGSLAIGASDSYICTKPNVPESFLNEATASGVTSLGLPASDSDTAFVKVINPTIKILKTPETQTILKGGAAAFTINVLNNSTVDLTGVQVIDARASGCNKTIGTLEAGEYHTYNCQKNNVNDAFVNIAIVQATRGSADVIDSDAAVVEVLDLDVNLVANPAALTEPGGVVRFTVTVTNHSSVDVTLTSLNTNRYGELTTANNNVENNNCTQSPIPAGGGQYTCSFEADFSEEPGAYPVNLTATAENDIPVSASDSATVTITPPPTSFLYLPAVLDTNDEPNNNCGQAFPITVNKDFFFLPDDTQDWYRFDLPQATGTLVVELTNFVPQSGQLLVYKDSSGCASLTNNDLIGQNGDFSPTKIVNLGPRPAGRYYVRVINDGPTSNNNFYKLRVRAP